MKIQVNSLCFALCLSLSTIAIVVTSIGCAGNRHDRSTGEYIDDKSLQLRVSSALSDNPDYKFEGVNIAVFKGTVQLSGFVDLSAQKSKASDIAQQIQGVKVVVNNITVKDQNNRNPQEYDDDKTMTARVKSALGNNPDYKFEEVNVTAFKGTVQLSGFVNTADQKSRAGDLAREISGVKDVVNNITAKDKM